MDRSAVLLRMAAGDFSDRDPLSVLVDDDWYRNTYPDVAAAGVSPVMHYLHHGWREGRDPNPWFPTWGYRSAYSDVADAKICPLVHFMQEGAAQGRRPHPVFDTAWYSRHYLGSDQPTIDAFVHFLTVGRSTGAAPNERFIRRAEMPERRASAAIRPVGEDEDALLRALVDPAWYRTVCPGIPESGSEALRHYLHRGWRQGLDPNPWFSTSAYRSAHPQAAEAGLCPLAHFVREGAAQGHRPHPDFDIAWYSRHHLGSDRPTAEALRHFLTVGLEAGAVPDPDLDGFAVRERLLAVPVAERTALIRRLQALSARAGRGPLDWEAEHGTHGVDAGLLAVWLIRGLARQASPVLILGDGADPATPSLLRLAARVLPPGETVLSGIAEEDGALLIGDGVMAVRFRLPVHTAPLTELLAAAGCHRAAALTPALGQGPVARGIRDARIPLPTESLLPGWS